MTVVIWPDLGPHIGVGHLMRCIALAEEVVARGGQVVFFVDASAVPFAAAQLAARSMASVAPPVGLPEQLAALEGLGPDAVVIDSYVLGVEGYAAVRARWRTLALADGDTAGREADVYVDQNIGAEEQVWPLAAGGERLAGLDFALMRNDLLAHRPAAPRVEAAAVPEVFAFFGGTDAYGAAPLAVRAMVASGAAWSATVVAATPALRAELEAIRPEDDQQLTVIGPTDRLAEQVAAADVVVSAAGTSSWELFCLGSAVAFVCVADNQAAAYRRVVDEGLAVGLGTVDDLRDRPEAIDRAGAVLRGLLGDPAERTRLRAATWQRVDGAGRGRVVDALLAGLEP